MMQSKIQREGRGSILRPVVKNSQKGIAYTCGVSHYLKSFHTMIDFEYHKIGKSRYIFTFYFNTI